MGWCAALITALTFAVGYFSGHVFGIDQETIDYMATNMNVRYDVLDNLRDGILTFKAQITLTNRGSKAIHRDSWVIYICHVRMIEPDFLPNPDGVVRDDIKFTHLQGCVFTLEPASTFKTILPDASKKIQFLGENWIVSKTDLMPNWYITAAGLTPRTITSTAGESLNFVGDFDRVAKWKRYGGDKYDPYTTRYRYALNDIKDLGKSPSYVIPTPLEIEVSEKHTVNLQTKDWVVIYPDTLDNEGKYITEKLHISRQKSIPIHRYIELKMEVIRVKLNGTLTQAPEAYTVDVNPEKEYIRISGQDPSGVFYGIQTLLALTHADGNIPNATVTDAPRFKYRGMELDVARNFVEQKTVLKLLDMMVTYKLNKFHFHLTDDEGWRLQIEGLEELTQIGGRRCHDLNETKCIMPQLGSGPTAVASGSGFYTKKEYQEILRYAKERHIEVIPEIDMPGHGHAVIKAMEARFHNLMNSGNTTEAKRYILIDHNDPSNYKSIQMYTDDAINPCLNTTYDFIRRVVNTLIEYHRPIMPLKLYHFGGDEVAKGTWENSTACESLRNANRTVIDKNILKEYFVREVSKITAASGLDLAAWEDGVMKSGTTPFSRSALQNQHIYAYAWDNVWEWGQASRAYKLANAGFKVVMSQATHLYFDHPYEPDPEERGYYWATRFTDTRKTFGFMPENLYANADVTRAGDPITEEELCGKDGKKCVGLEKTENLAGMQGHLWSETVRSPEELDFMVFPRLLALAERAWHRAAWESELNKSTRKIREKEHWERFANTLGYREMRRLDSLGVKYRVPPPGAIVQNGRILANTAFPGLIVQCSMNGGKSWQDVDSMTQHVTDGLILLRTMSASGSRYSRVVKLVVPTSTGTTTSPSSGKSYIIVGQIQAILSVFSILALVLSANMVMAA